MRKEEEGDIGARLVAAVRERDALESQESFARAMELTKAYAASGSATNFNTIPKLFYDLFEMFETGRDPRSR